MMSNDKSCGKCSLTIDAAVDSFSVCGGKCFKMFHLECAGLSLSDLSVLSYNIIWVCDACMRDLCRYRVRKFADSTTNTLSSRTVEDEIHELKNTVAAIADTLANVTQKTRPVPNSSTPISSLKVLNGTNETFDFACDDRSTMGSSSTDECREFSLYLTHIDRRATENDIKQMVSRSLSAPLSDCYEVVKLVPRWRNVNTLDYISFRIMLDKKWKILAMNPSTWPKGVVFREFVSRQSEPWRPN